MQAGISQRIEVLRFPLIIGIVFIHNFDAQTHMAGYDLGPQHSAFAVEFTRALISQGVARIAVPLFFLISGYLFYQGYDLSAASYRQKLKRRVGTLLVPFIFWNAFTVSLFAVGEYLPFSARFFSYSHWPPIASFHLLDYLNAIGGLWSQRPICYQFWFFRDLMALVLLVPILDFLFSHKLGTPLLICAFAFWFSGRWPVLWPSSEATFFFCLGSFLSLGERNLYGFDRYRALLVVPFLLALIYSAAFPDARIEPYVYRMMLTLGLPLVWWLSGWTNAHTENLRRWLVRLSPVGSFVFAAHEPLLTITRKVVFKLVVPKSGAVVLALYFSLPVCLILFLVLCYRCLQVLQPRLLEIVTGEGVRSKRYGAAAPEALRADRESRPELTSH